MRLRASGGIAMRLGVPDTIREPRRGVCVDLQKRRIDAAAGRLGELPCPAMTALHSPAADRNKDPILAELRKVLPETGTVLEIASGSGQHVVHFARNLRTLRFLPSDPTEDARESIRTLIAESGLENIEAPRAVDVLDASWTAGNEPRADAIVCINMIHISPVESLPALVLGASRRLAPGGVLFLYGPFRFHGRFLAPSNAAFSADLQRRNPSWGVRDVDDVARHAERHGFAIREPIALPANNHVIVLRAGGTSVRSAT